MKDYNISIFLIFFGAFFISFLKYVVPPLPCDLSLLILIFTLALRGVNIIPVLVVMVLGWTSGAYFVYFLSKNGKFVFKIENGFFKKLQDAFKRFSFFVLLFNRFLPGIRPFIFPFAGILRVNPFKVVVLSFFGNLFYAIFFYFLVNISHKKIEVLKGFYNIILFWLEFVLLSIMTITILYFYRKRFMNFEKKG